MCLYDIMVLGCDNMYAYIKGKVTEQTSNQIIVENNGIGYFINVSNPYSYQLNTEVFIYLYEHIKEDEHSLYGFQTFEEKELFLKLIEVKGIGPKMALPMFATGSINGIVDAIERENVLYLKKFPKIGEKVARQIILDLKGKLAKPQDVKTASYEELIEVLKGLGYKEKDFKAIIPKIDVNLDIEMQVKEALKLLLK